ncbi:MAG: SWIM zinc finger family protein [Acidobacteria bacterium]|nr:SWIM zinc finger family protein [Acidobacteriota bacterium]
MINMATEHHNALVNRAKAIAAMGLVGRDYEGFNVTSPGFRKETFRIWKDEEGRVKCSCAEFQERSLHEPRFRCEHILAVKFHLEATEEAAEPQNHNDTPGAVAAPEQEEQTAGSPLSQEAPVVDENQYKLFEDKMENRVIPFDQLLKRLSQSIQPEMVKQRVGWRDRQGREHEVDYVEWHTVADLLDRICPNWSHQVNNIKQIGDLVAVTASITIQGVTRQGVGTGSAYDETGIKKAEHDALKRAAVKFGIARELYRKEEEVINETATQPSFPREPMAKTMAELVTPRQLVAIRAISNSQKIDAEAECKELLQCKPEELSRKAASAFIDYLKSKDTESAELRHVG